jgi:hypothetical protein
MGKRARRRSRAIWDRVDKYEADFAARQATALAPVPAALDRDVLARLGLGAATFADLRKRRAGRNGERNWHLLERAGLLVQADEPVREPPGESLGTLYRRLVGYDVGRSIIAAAFVGRLRGRLDRHWFEVNDDQCLFDGLVSSHRWLEYVSPVAPGTTPDGRIEAPSLGALRRAGLLDDSLQGRAA